MKHYLKSKPHIAVAACSLQRAPLESRGPQAYRAQSKIYHPDKFKGDKEEAQERMVQINEAYRRPPPTSWPTQPLGLRAI